METELTVTKEQKKKSLPSKMEFDASPASLIALAVDKDLDIEKLQKLIDMKNANDDKIAKKEFIQALTDFQAECPEIVKKRAGYENRYKFADIGSVDRTIKPLMKKHGLKKDWKFHHFKSEEKKPMIRVTCIISHIGGHSEETSMEAEHDTSGGKNEIQARGSSIKYLERYTLEAALGLTTILDDNDGADGQGNLGKLPSIKDSQLGSVIKSISEGKYTFDAEKLTLMAMDKEIAKATEKQAASLKKAQEEFNAKPKQ